MRGFGPDAQNAEGRRVELQLGGHIIEVIIHRPGEEPADANALPFMEAGGLIDTGASDVCIDFRIAHDLRLRQVDQRTVGTLGGSVPAAVYMGVLEVPALGFKRRMPLYAFKVRRVTFSVVLGRSFLENYVVTFNGPEGYCVFADPVQAYSPPVDDE